MRTIKAVEEAERYLDQFRRAETLQQQRTVVEGYRLFYNRLAPDEQTQADAVMQALWSEIDNEVAELDRLTQHARQQLSNNATLPLSS